MNSGNGEPITPRTSTFESIRRQAEDGSEYWNARDLAKILGYNRWENFQNVIPKAKTACANSGHEISDHFRDVTKMVKLGSRARREVEDFELSRYACYLIVQNADPSKEIVALGQTYFAVQTRRQELTDELTTMSEDQLRLVRRSQISILNNQLAGAAQGAGVIEPKDFAIFQDHGYIGLYGGLKARDIHTRKGLKKSQEILDYMGSDELAANAFRASLTRQKIERERIKDKNQANRTHHEMGQEVRETIKRAGATLPEDMPTPAKSIQQLQREEQKQLEQGQQPSLFGEPAEE